MERLEIKKLYETEEYDGKIITVCGWIKTLRDSKAVGFIEINDGSCFKGVQIVFEAEKLDNYKDIAKLNVGSAVKVTGKLLLTPQANQPFEINATEIVIEGESTPIEIRPYITGWWLHNTPVKSWLIKDLSSTYNWKNSSTGIATDVPAATGWWNTPSFYRSYWANCPDFSLFD